MRCAWALAWLTAGTWSGSGFGAALQPAGNLPAPAGAAALAPDYALDARALGVMEAVFDFCTSHDAESAPKVRAHLKQLVQGASDQALAQVRQSGAYRSARDAELDFVGKVDPHNAHRICLKAAAPGRDAAGSPR